MRINYNINFYYFGQFGSLDWNLTERNLIGTLKEKSIPYLQKSYNKNMGDLQNECDNYRFQVKKLKK
jgi:hypothetical protein